MKRIVRKRVFLIMTTLISIILAAMLVGCGGGAGGGGGDLAPLQGHWVDVNSDTTLDFDGNRMTVSYGSWSDTYRVKLRGSGSIVELVPADDKTDFGMMSAIRVGDDGALTAYEMILDGDSHQYRFVREEALEDELAIRDLSRDAPKTIESKDIERFHLYFSDPVQYGADPAWPSARYSWEIVKEEDGSYTMDFSGSGSSYIVLSFSAPVSEEYVTGLAQLLEETGAIRHNGYYMTNNVDRPGYELVAEYASGERLSVYADGTPSDSCVFDLPALLDYAAQQDLWGTGAP